MDRIRKKVMSKIHNVEFDIAVPPSKLYVKNLTSDITMRSYYSVQVSFPPLVSMYCSPRITLS